MAIAKKPKSNTKGSKEATANKFINKPETTSIRLVSTTLRIPEDMLSEVDAAAKYQGVSRSAWIKRALRTELDNEQ